MISSIFFGEIISRQHFLFCKHRTDASNRPILPVCICLLQRCQSRLHQKAQLEQIGCHLYFVRQKFQTEWIFADTAACRYKGTRATADFYHTAADQCFDCFTQGTASNAKRFCQFKFIRQLTPGLSFCPIMLRTISSATRSVSSFPVSMILIPFRVSLSVYPAAVLQTALSLA